MSPQCEALTPAEAVLYCGIPSLIYSVKALGEMTPEASFANKFPPCSFLYRTDMLKAFVISFVDNIFCG
jgi:hypothetical protein